MSIDLTKPFRRLAPSAEPEIDIQTGRATFIFNTEDVGRDGHIVRNAGIRTDNFDANPAILFAHAEDQPPVGRATAIRIGSPASRVEIEFTPRDIYPFGAMIGDLVKARYLNACSMSWQPIKWHFRDAKEGRGVIFDEVDLLEISVVPVPALPEAIATARSRGIDTAPLFEWAEKLLDGGGIATLPRTELETLRRAAKMPTPSRSSKAAEWKVGAARDLPIEDDDSWDGAAAEKSIFEYAGGATFSAEKARKGFLAYDAENPEERGSYKLPIAHVIGGELKVPKGAIRAAASRLPDTDIPDDVKKKAEAVLDHYKEKAGIDDDEEEKKRAAIAHAAQAVRIAKAGRRAAALPIRRGLWDVAQVAYILAQYGCIHAMAVEEAAREGDDSAVPGVMLEALETMVEAFKAHASEEADELLEDAKGGSDDDGLPEGERAFVAAGKTAFSRAVRRGIALSRAGKVLSASNKERLESAQAHHERALKHHASASDHHKALGDGIEKLRAIHKRAAGAEPEKVSRALGEMSEALDGMADVHEDHGDAHRAIGRSVRAAHRNVQAVVDGSESKDDVSDQQDQDAQVRERLAKAIKIRGQ